ncbi:hypothetical protein TeGR_g1270 [Tetraparma gracilis]|uniref:Cyclic nucleotide-binding domain-containing protein n=1 Tax=Tetraparma gracilis TaxID=2962635 RepID=A0ABQ6N8Z3_9STRA|nr:hypothetical protein TeGR_g1270 [Tetraparma gracilis]
MTRFNTFSDLVIIDDTDTPSAPGALRSNRQVPTWRLPASEARAYWETLHFLVSSTNCFIVPVRMVFAQRETYYESFVFASANNVIAATLLLDFYLRCRKFCFEEGGQVATSSKAIYHHYKKGWMYIDLVSAFPSFNVSAPPPRACAPVLPWMLQPKLAIQSSSMMEQLNAAVYVVAQALYTVGYGDIPISNTNLARSFSVVIMFIGSFCFAMVIAVMSSVIANQDILYMEFRQKMETLSSYMKYRGLKEELQMKISNHFDYLFSVQFGKLELQILDELPAALKSEVLMLNEFLVKNHPFIKSSNDKFFTGELIKILIPRTYSPNEVVVFRHSPTPCMFFIRFGKINLLALDDVSTVTSLLAGEHFGGFEFLFDVLFEHTHKTGTFSELLVLERSQFDTLLAHPRFEDQQKHLKATVTDLSKYLNQSLLGVGQAKYTKTQKKLSQRERQRTTSLDVTAMREEEDEKFDFDFDFDTVSPSTSTPNSPMPPSRSADGSSSPKTPSSPKRTLKEFRTLNKTLRDPTDVFPHRLIRKLASDISTMKASGTMQAALAEAPRAQPDLPGGELLSSVVRGASAVTRGASAVTRTAVPSLAGMKSKLPGTFVGGIPSLESGLSSGLARSKKAIESVVGKGGKSRSFKRSGRELSMPTKQRETSVATRVIRDMTGGGENVLDEQGRFGRERVAGYVLEDLATVAEVLHDRFKRYACARWEVLPGTLGNSAVRYHRRLDSDSVLWGRARGTVAAAADRVAAFMWAASSYARCEEHKKDHPGRERVTVPMEGSRSQLTLVKYKVGGPLDDRVVALWNTWDVLENGNIIIAISDYEESGQSAAVDELERHFFPALNGGVRASFRGGYLFQSMAPNVCQLTAIFRGTVGGALVPSMTANMILRKGLTPISKMQDGFRRGSRQVDAEIRNHGLSDGSALKGLGTLGAAATPQSQTDLLSKCLAIDKGDEDAPAFSIRASVISSARSSTRSTSSSTRSAIGVGGSRKKVKRKSVFGSRAFGDGGNITLQLKALAGLRTASEWEIVESPSALVDMHAKFEHASEGTRPAVLGRADSILDCSPEEAFLWLVSGPTSLEQTRLGQDRGDPLSIVVSEKGPFEYVKAAIRKFPFRITNREYVMSTIGIRGEGGSYIVGASSVDKSVPIDYGGSSFRSIRGDLTCLTVIYPHVSALDFKQCRVTHLMRWNGAGNVPTWHMQTELPSSLGLIWSMREVFERDELVDDFENERLADKMRDSEQTYSASETSTVTAVRDKLESFVGSLQSSPDPRVTIEVGTTASEATGKASTTFDDSLERCAAWSVLMDSRFNQKRHIGASSDKAVAEENEHSSVFLGTLGSSSRITSTREFLMRVIWLREDIGTILVVGSSIEMNEIPHDATMKRISVEMLWKFTAMDEVAGVPQTHVSWTLSTKEPGLGIFHADAALVLAQLGHLAERRVAVDRSADIDDNVTIRNRADLEQHSPDDFSEQDKARISRGQNSLGLFSLENKLSKLKVASRTIQAKSHVDMNGVTWYWGKATLKASSRQAAAAAWNFERRTTKQDASVFHKVITQSSTHTKIVYGRKAFVKDIDFVSIATWRRTSDKSVVIVTEPYNAPEMPVQQQMLRAKIRSFMKFTDTGDSESSVQLVFSAEVGAGGRRVTEQLVGNQLALLTSMQNFLQDTVPLDEWSPADGTATGERLAAPTTAEAQEGKKGEHFEHVAIRVFEVFGEAIPGCVLQCVAIMNGLQDNTLTGANLAASIASIAISAATCGFTMGTISFDYDVHPARRKDPSQKQFYGYVPDTALGRTGIFVTMCLNNAIMLIIRSMGMALMLAYNTRALASCLLADFAIYFILKVVRRDFWYWAMDFRSTPANVMMSITHRLVCKTVVDFTSVIQFSHPGELGGVYFTYSVATSLAFLLVAFSLYFGSRDADDVFIEQDTALVGVLVLESLWCVSFSAIIYLMKPGHRSRFTSTMTSRKLLQVKVWLATNWAKWEEGKPEWFDDLWKNSIPDDLLPPSAERNARASTRSAIMHMRSSLRASGINGIGPVRALPGQRFGGAVRKSKAELGERTVDEVGLGLRASRRRDGGGAGGARVEPVMD